MSQRATFNQLHHDEVELATGDGLVPNVVDPYDAWVMDPAPQVTLAQEPASGTKVRLDLGVKHLHGHQLPGLSVSAILDHAGTIDRTIAA